MKRAFSAPPQTERCAATVRLRDGTTAQCMRRAVVLGKCRQHQAMAGDFPKQYRA